MCLELIVRLGRMVCISDKNLLTLRSGGLLNILNKHTIHVIVVNLLATCDFGGFVLIKNG